MYGHMVRYIPQSSTVGFDCFSWWDGEDLCCMFLTCTFPAKCLVLLDIYRERLMLSMVGCMGSPFGV